MTIAAVSPGAGELSQSPAKHERARDHATSDVPRAGVLDRVEDVRQALAGAAFASASEIVVCEGERLLGFVPIERLLAAEPALPVGNLLEEPVTVDENDDQELAAARSARAGGRSVAVIGTDGRFLGLLPPAQLIPILHEEHEEDLARLGGYLSRASAARSATEEAIPRRLWHRIPWLLLGLAGAMATAGIVSSFEDELRSEVLLAFFVPAVVYMADAVGTQTETVVIRGMSLGIPIGRVFRRELTTGLIMGTLLAAAFLPFAMLAWGDAAIAVTVSLALLVSSSIATVIAMVLPYALSRLGRDPAFGSGPLATVIQDLLSIAVYFGIAILLVG
jgi:magnesium transporter